MIDKATITYILDTAQIVDVVSDFVRLKKKGQNYWGLCPFHSDRTPSFSVSPSRNICKCFSCGEGGSPLNFIMKHEGLEYVDALKWLAKKYNIEIAERKLTDQEKEKENIRQSLIIVNDFAQKFFSNELLNTQEGKDVGLSYFTHRGISLEMIEKFALGYSPSDKYAIQKKSKEMGYNIERLVDLGLVIKYDNKVRVNFVDRFRDRVIFPIFNVGGRVVGFGGRIMVANEKRGKYVNSPESSIYSKSNELYGLFQAKTYISKHDKVYFVEGYLDVISLVQSGIENVVAGSGTALTERQINLLSRFTKNITLLYDGDKAGIKAALRGVDMLLKQDMKVTVVPLPDGEDPDSFAQTHTTDELSEYLKNNEIDFISFKTSLLNEEIKDDPLKKSQLITDVISSISLIPDNITKSVYIKSLSTQLDIDESILSSELKKIQRNIYNNTVYNFEKFEDTKDSNTIYQSIDNPNFGLHPFEIELAKLIIAKGTEIVHCIISYDDNGTPSWGNIPLVEMIKTEIMEEDISSDMSQLFLSIIDELSINVLPYSNTDSFSYFLNHPNKYFRNIANTIYLDAYSNEEYINELLSDDSDDSKEKLKNAKAVRLGQRAYRELNSVKMKLVIELIKETQEELKDPEVIADEEKLSVVMDNLNVLNEIKTSLAQELGERTIIG